MFYAVASPYGTNMMSKADGLYRFETRAERDAWTQDAWRDGRMVRDKITRSQARCWWPRAFRDADDWLRDDPEHWRDPDANGAQEWSGSPTGGGYKYL